MSPRLSQLAALGLMAAAALSARAQTLPRELFAPRTCRTDIRGSIEKLRSLPRRTPSAPAAVPKGPAPIARTSASPAVTVLDGSDATRAAQQYGNVTIYEVDTLAAAAAFFAESPDTATSGWDEVVFFTTFVTTQAGGAYYLPLSNDVSGISRTYLAGELGANELFNLNEQGGTGSKGFLKGTVLMSDWHTCNSARYLGIPCDNKPPYDGSQRGVLSILGQEVGHRWGAFMYFKDGGTRSDELLGRDLAHWSYYVDTDGSPIEGNRWKLASPGRWALDPVSSMQFSPLDLYAMGALPPEEVPPTLLIRQPSPPPCTTERKNPDVYMRCTTNSATPPAEGSSQLAGTERRVTVEEVIASEGARKPAFPSAIRRVNLAFALLELPNQRASNAEQLTLDGLRRTFTRSFYDGTNRRMRAITTLSRADDLGLFDFTLDGEGWVGSDGVLPLDGQMQLPLAAPSSITHANLELDTAKEAVLHLDVTTARLSEVTLRIKWSTQATGDWNTLEVPVPATGMPRTLMVPMAGVPGWTGRVRRMSLEAVPVNAPAASELAIALIETAPAAKLPDQDGDMIPDAQDNCPGRPNTDQHDTDANGLGNACDAAPGSGGDVGGCHCGSAMAAPALAVLSLWLRRRRPRT